MAPVKQGKPGIKPKPGQKSSSKPGQKSSSSKPLKGDSGKKRGKAPPPVQQKTKSAKSLDQKKRKRRVYSEKELNIPKLNMITPAGVQKPRGKKKGKVFVDDPYTMQTILALVNAETEGKIESKMLKSRQMEEIREARQREMDAKDQQRKDALENKKNELRKSRKKPKGDITEEEAPPAQKASIKKAKKRVSFG